MRVPTLRHVLQGLSAFLALGVPSVAVCCCRSTRGELERSNSIQRKKEDRVLGRAEKRNPGQGWWVNTYADIWSRRFVYFRNGKEARGLRFPAHAKADVIPFLLHAGACGKPPSTVPEPRKTTRQGLFGQLARLKPLNSGSSVAPGRPGSRFDVPSVYSAKPSLTSEVFMPKSLRLPVCTLCSPQKHQCLICTNNGVSKRAESLQGIDGYILMEFDADRQHNRKSVGCKQGLHY